MGSMGFRLLVAASLLAQGSLAATFSKRATPSISGSGSSTSQTPLPPSKDPWYTAPDGFELKPPGAVLRIRSAPGNLTSISGNCSATYNVLYRTTDSQYNPTWAVTTVFVPVIRKAALLSYQIPYDSADVNESPSYAMYSGVPLDVNQSLSKGWFVNVPDYEGPLASFTAGVMSGHATLDSVRATLSLKDSFLLPNETLSALWGYSGGALASEWALELAVQYAPELNISGAALGGLTPNITSVLQTINRSYAAGLAVSAILGITSQFPPVFEYVTSRLKPSGPDNATTFLAAMNMSLAEAGGAFAFKDISKFFINGFDDLLNNSATRKIILSDGLMGWHGVPASPLFVYKSVGDLISPINDTDKLVSKYCEVGVNILYERNNVGGHSAEATNGRPAAVAWLDAVLNGTYAELYATEGCRTENVSVNITSSPLRRRSMVGNLIPDQN
ncbi:lipase 1 [Coniochaeta sp. 2T2.1]|nr:lipase 1 [Coniochaeta sp. 2T2.1]